MTDPNRGAYTPQSDAPLSFDARRAGGSRGPMPITLIFSALILLVLVVGGGIAILYHNGSRKAGEAPQPVGEAVGAMRGAAEGQNAPATATPAAGPSAAAPTFTPPPEQPAARPVEAAPPPPPPPPPPAPKTTAPTATAPVTSTPVGPPPVAKAEPVKTPPPAPKAAAPAVKVAEAAPKAAAVAPAKPAAAAGGPMVQIGAYSSTSMADTGWNEVAKLMPGEMAGKTKVVEKLDRDGKTLYRTLIGGFATHKDAERLCLALLSKGRDCSVK